MIELKHITKIFHTQKGDISACQDVNLTIQDGEIFGVIGYSGAGKSTLVRIINQLEKQTSGEVIIDGEDISQLSGERLRKKRTKIGMIFQHFNLLWSRTVQKNIELSLEIAGVDKQTRQQKAKQLIELVGLTGRENAYPSELSGGQKQRVGIARALANDPHILLCDEATSALDNESESIVQESLEKLSQDRTTFVIAHRLSTIKNAKHICVLTENGIEEQGNHEELMKLNGNYARLYNMQFKGEK
mgnify:CR=1 FL=1